MHATGMIRSPSRLCGSEPILPMADASDDNPSVSIRAISRALQILRIMNTQPTWSLHSLHLQTALPKSTIFRILHTLQLEGYVRLEGVAGVYRLTEKILEMSGGFTEKSLLVEVGSPLALRLTKQIKWPVALGVRPVKRPKQTPRPSKESTTNTALFPVAIKTNTPWATAPT